LRDRDIRKTKELSIDSIWVLLRKVDPTIQEFERDPITATSNVEMNSRA
jgi:hypothetical protein